MVDNSCKLHLLSINFSFKLFSARIHLARYTALFSVSYHNVPHSPYFILHLFYNNSPSSLHLLLHLLYLFHSHLLLYFLFSRTIVVVSSFHYCCLKILYYQFMLTSYLPVICFFQFLCLAPQFVSGRYEFDL